ncbi:MAG: SDR family NAD(P)-dependent oxidoreductase [Proteiniphilum sp.]|jgi:NADP-dependent 3-hydroxy acid dehydrogenase YdfG|nr:SDR family NAD(P)-dependent oxidoreductase [Proteiniphilum sp.]
MRQTAIITGATSGIGEATALKLAENGFDLIITGRRQEKLESLKERLEKTGSRISALRFDVRSEAEVNAALGNLSPEWNAIDVLVNNAGLAAGLEPLQQGDSSDWNRMIDTNIKGMLYVTRSISPGMIARKRGHILNIGSVAGKEVYPGGNVYCATKHAVDALTKGMRFDLLPHGIKVTQICPGAVETEFSLVRFHGDRARADKVYEGYESLTADDVAACILFAVTRPPHVNISDITVMPSAQASATVLHKTQHTRLDR